MAVPRYVLDANVLYPSVLRDLLLTLASTEAFQPLWSDEIIDEMRRNVLANNPHIDPSTFTAGTIRSMQKAFPDAIVAGYEYLLSTMDNDPKDRHVAAVAVHAAATGIVTYNQKDFNGEQLSNRSIRVIPPALLIQEVFDLDPNIVANAIIAMAARKRQPPMTAAQVLKSLGKQHDFHNLSIALTSFI